MLFSVVFGTTNDDTEQSHGRDQAAAETRRTERRGGWHVKPRQGQMYHPEEGRGLAPIAKKDDWEHDPSMSTWHKFFPTFADGSEGDEDEERFSDQTWFESQFREEFHVSQRVFYYHLRLLHQSGEFEEKVTGDGSKGRRTHPLRLKLAFSFVRLSEGISFKRGQTLACISNNALRRFHRHLVSFWYRTEYAKHVYLPTTAQEVRVIEAKYSKMGMGGACVSYDGVPVPYPHCPAGATGQHLGKEGYPTRRFMVGVEPDGLILSMGAGSHQGTRNDLTMSTLDPFLTQLRDGNFFPDYTYQLEDQHGENVTMKGLFAIVDNGFHKWRCCQPPDKATSDIWRLRWSKRLESIRKDSECCFGRGKSRFACMRHGPATADLQYFDESVFACAMLHNQLIRADGLSNPRTHMHYWKPANTDLDSQRIANEHAAGRSGFGYEHPVNNAAVGNETVAEVQSEYIELQLKLVEHFKRKWESGTLLWPKKKHYFSTVKTRGSRMRDTREKEAGTFSKRHARDPEMYEHHAWESTVENLREVFDEEEEEVDSD